jgi:hypothetical protein
MLQFQPSDMKVSVLFRFTWLHQLTGYSAKMKKNEVDHTLLNEYLLMTWQMRPFSQQV